MDGNAFDVSTIHDSLIDLFSYTQILSCDSL